MEAGRMRVLYRWIGAVMALGLLQAQAAPVARLNGVPIDGLTLDVLHRVAALKQPTATRMATLNEIIENRLLAAQIPRRFKQYDLSANQRVAFAPEVAAEDQLVNYLTVVYATQIQAELKKIANQPAPPFKQPEPASWNVVFGDPDKILLDYRFGPEHYAKAKNIGLLQDRQTGVVSLRDVMRRQNVQGRLEFFNRNFAWVEQQARQYLAGKAVMAWARQRFGARAVADLQQALQEREQARAVLALHGVGNDIDADSGLINDLARRVTEPEIVAYYQTNLAQFKRIVRINARHIRVGDETLAQQISTRAAKGEDFAQLARQYSQVPDAAQGGALGWIAHENKLNWLAEIAFTQDPGQVSPPFRTPVGPNELAAWEIVRVEQREDGYQGADSEAVRYVARRSLAQHKALQQLAWLRQTLLRKASLQKMAQKIVQLDAAQPGTHGMGKS